VSHIADHELKARKCSDTGPVRHSPTLMRSAAAVEDPSSIPYPLRPPITPGEKHLTLGLATGLALRAEMDHLAVERLRRIELLEQQNQALRSAAAEADTQRAARQELQRKWCTALEQVAEQRAARDEAERQCEAALEQVTAQRANCAEVESKMLLALKHTEEQREVREKVERQLADTLLQAHKTACEEAKMSLAVANAEMKSSEQGSWEVECRLTEALEQVDVHRARRELLEGQLAVARDAQQIYVRQLAAAERQVDSEKILCEEALKHQDILACRLREAETKSNDRQLVHEETEGKLADALKRREIFACRLEEAEKQADAQRAVHEATEGQLAEALKSEQIYVRRLDDALQQVEKVQRSLVEAEQVKLQVEQQKHAREEAEQRTAEALEQLEAERRARRASEAKVEALQLAAHQKASQQVCHRFQAAVRGARLVHEGQEWEALQRTEEELRQQVELLEGQHEAAERQLADSNQSLLTQRSALTSLELSLNKICGNMDEAVTEWLPWSDLKEVQGRLRTTQLIVQEALNHHESL